ARRRRRGGEGGRRRHRGDPAHRGHRRGEGGAAASAGAADGAELTDLDLSPLGRRAGVLARLRAIGSSPRLVIGATIGVLVLLGPSIGILVAVLGTEADRGFVGTMALFGACGVWVLIDVLRKAGTGAGL